MNFFEDDHTRQPWEDPPPTAVAALQSTVRLDVRPVERDETPEGLACLAAHIDGRLVARSAVREDMAGRIGAIFEDPVPLVIAGREKDGGIDCRLFAVVPATRVRALQEEDEPWKTSVPGAGYDDPLQGEGKNVGVLFPLGTIVRVPGDRIAPDDLTAEVGDILRKVVNGETSEVVDRLLDSL